MTEIRYVDLLGIDRPEVRQLPAFSQSAQFLFIYRRWHVYMTLHVLNGTVFGEFHGILEHVCCGQTRQMDGTVPSALSAAEVPAYIMHVTPMIKQKIDEAWAAEDQGHQNDQAHWEQSWRDEPAGQGPGQHPNRALPKLDG